ncbi:MAG TPA: cysteine--tRNA ligase [Bdellovibrionales bacterium]|nr:cysteine--tRNA ligase [Pseudobdellovibrionaceae bacterium]HAG90236.1 cysteine--tRNA ligase [Bdellovibrionales bacterium]|tara:strand:- start:17538 stop:18992 length:1455 start_codon:yes stop_codon:yes gene_type:complete
MIQIHNSQSGKKEEFKTLEPGKVRMYVCGPTVYDFLHVGNFRGPIFFNLVRNWLEKNGYEVTYVYNYTDVDDKIIDRANKENRDPKEVAETFIKEFEKDYNSLKLRPHSKNPKVTEHMDDIVNLIRDLVEKGKAYEQNGDVYFDVTSFGDYGKLSHKNIEELETGHRVQSNENKKHVADFALWKKAKEGEPHWSSPWSEGRPGWHIECSAMSRALLGEQIDIHGGGLDLIFPHHENEIAQSEGASGKEFVRYWMHNNMLNFGNQKMSKSLGNMKFARQFLEEYNPEIFKALILSSHYRSVLDFTDSHIHQILQMLGRIYSALAHAEDLSQTGGEKVPVPESFQKEVESFRSGYTAALNDDFNSAEVFAKVFDLVRAYNHLCRKPGKIQPGQVAAAKEFLAQMKELGGLMALFLEPPKDYLVQLDDLLLEKKGLQRSEIDQLVTERAKARADKDFQKSDELRDKLKALGISVSDGPQGSTWEVQK